MIFAGALVITALAPARFQPMTAYAVQGWMSDGEEWKYLDEDDNPLKNTWKQSRDSWFYLGDQGIMVGYATDETPERMPLPVVLAQKLCRGLDESPAKRKRFASEVERFQKRWAKQLAAGDPCMNPNFDLMKEDFSFDIKPLE